jgi:GTPase SAR1 family protein
MGHRFGDLVPAKKILTILVVEETGAGRTALLLLYVQGFFREPLKPTIGAGFSNKDLELDDNTSIRLRLWEIPGAERFGNMTRVYSQERSPHLSYSTSGGSRA